MTLSPTTPHQPAGSRVEPPLSLPIEPPTRRAATAAAEPLEEPPVTCAGFHGLVAGPWAEAIPVVPRPSSCWLSTPTTTAPASRRRRNGPEAVAAPISSRVPLR